MVSLIETTNEACYMYQVSCQSDELCRRSKRRGPIDPIPSRLRLNIFYFEASRPLNASRQLLVQNANLVGDLNKIQIGWRGTFPRGNITDFP